MDNEKAIRAAKLTLGGILEKRRAQEAKDRAPGQIAPSKYLPEVPRQVHAYGGRANERNDIWWHGSPSGDLRGGTSGLHLGTKEAALDALRARIGVPADGSMWDGTKEYGKTLLAGQNTLNRMGKYLITGHNSRAPMEDYYPHQHPEGMPTVGAGVPVDPTWKPFLRPFKIVGPMTNSPYRPHGDSRANAMMKASLTKGSAKNGYYYTNDGEDSGSISAVVPNGSHVEPVDQDNKYASGGYVPTAGLPIPRLAVARPLSVGQQQQPGFFDALNSVASLGKTAMGIKNLVSPEEEDVQQKADPDSGSQPHVDASGFSPSADHGGMSDAATSAYAKLIDAYGQPLTVVSAYRDPKRNEEAGGAKGSQHMHGNAYDIDTSNLTHEERLALADQAWAAGFRGIGFYDNNMHFDVGDPRAWGPDYHRGSIPDWAQPWAQKRFGYADGGEVADLGQAREAKQLQGFHTGMMGDISDAAAERMEVHQKALDAGVFDGYEMGDVLQGKNAPMKITGRFVRPWKPSRANLEHFDRMGAKPTIIEHNGKQYIPMLRTLTGVKGTDDWQEGDAYLDGVKAMGYPKMGGLRAVKAAGGAAMFEGIHPDLQDEQGNPKDLWHGTPGEPFDEFKDEKIGRRDPGFYGRGHYLTAQRGNAEAYADPEEMQRGSVIGPLHAALKNPFVWDASSPESLHRTMRKLQDFGVMGGKDRLDPWDALKPHEIDQFMQSAVANGHDGVIRKTGRGLSEIVVFKPSAIKHRDAERFDPNDPNIYHARGGVAK